MFSVKISYHHQRRLAIHYRVEALLNDSWVASPAENPLLSAWSSLVWRWTLSTQGFFEANLCCNSSFGRASARSSFINRAEEEYSKIQHHFHQHLKNSTSISPPPAFLSMRPSWEQPKAALRFLWALRWEGRAEAVPIPLCAPKSALSPGSVRFSPSEPRSSTHTSWYSGSFPSLHQDLFQMPQNFSFLILKWIFSLCKST